MRGVLLSLCLAAIVAPAAAIDQNMSISVDDWSDVVGCDQINVRFDHQRAYRAEEQLPVAGLRSLKIDSAHNGGIRVVGTDARDYSVTACKAAALEDTLRDLRVRLDGNEVTAAGPDGGGWVVYFLVRAPRNATLDLRSKNGPIGVQNVIGTVTARAINGPISVKGSSGTMDIDTTNGPISLEGGSGTMKLNAQNGPIAVKFTGASWDGDLEAHTQNGPLSIKMPRDFRSSVRVESDGHGPISCRAEACRQARRTWDDEDQRRIELGSGPAVVRMSTVNGPISVKENE
jgi:DUF4097 and DUF4098 domain-containing protein YvlB